MNNNLHTISHDFPPSTTRYICELQNNGNSEYEKLNTYYAVDFSSVVEMYNVHKMFISGVSVVFLSNTQLIRSIPDETYSSFL